MNQKKAKSLRKLARSMVAEGLVTAGASYESRTYTRPAIMNPDGTIARGPYEVKTIRVNPRSERGIYLRMKKDAVLRQAA
jgi:hypothetical protein